MIRRLADRLLCLLLGHDESPRTVRWQRVVPLYCRRCGRKVPRG